MEESEELKSGMLNYAVRKTDFQMLTGTLSFLSFVSQWSEETNASVHSRQGRLGFRTRFVKSANWERAPFKQREQPAADKN